MSKKIKEALKILIFFSLGLFIAFQVYNTMSQEDKTDFWNALSGANYTFIIIAFSLGAFAHYIRALRWKLIIESAGYKPKTYNLYFAVMNMYFFNAFVPRLGEVTRCAILKNYENIPVEKSLGTVVAERAVDMVVFFMLLGGLALFDFEVYIEVYDSIQLTIKSFLSNKGENTSPGFFAKNWKYLALAAAALVFGMLFLFRKNPFINKIYLKVRGLLMGFWQGLKSTFLIRRKGLFIFYSLSIWGLYFIMTYICFFSLPQTATYNLLTPFVIMVFSSFAVMATPNGLGLFPLVVAVILGLPTFGSIPQGTGNALGWIIWGSQEVMVLSIGLIVMILIPIFNKKPAQSGKV